MRVKRYAYPHTCTYTECVAGAPLNAGARA